MKYLNLFDSHDEFLSNKKSLQKSYVCLCDDDSHIHYSSDRIHVNNNGYGYVDLGLPSGALWCTYNVGASSITGEGLYFQFGDVVGYRDASHTRWSTCPFNGGYSEFNSSYFSEHMNEWLDGKVLKSDYDAVHFHMGGDWMMPTKVLLDELFNYTEHEWVNGFMGTNVNGMKFVSKCDVDSFLFFPATAGMWNGYKDTRNTLGQVWGSTYDTSGRGYSLFYSRDESDKVRSISMYYALNIRGVIFPINTL